VPIRCSGGFKSGSLRQQVGSHDQFNKLYDRILSRLAILQQICPSFATSKELIMRACRDKHREQDRSDDQLRGMVFQAPKFFVPDPAAGNIHNQQTAIVVDEMSHSAVGKTLRSYMKLYTSMSAEKLAHFHDLNVNAFIPLLLAYKLRMQQTERTTTTTTMVGGSYLDGVQQTAMGIHYYLNGGGDKRTSTIVRVDQPAIQRRFKTYFAAQISQCADIQKQAEAII
jgi:translation initiation factor 3 subunit L